MKMPEASLNPPELPLVGDIQGHFGLASDAARRPVRNIGAFESGGRLCVKRGPFMAWMDQQPPVPAPDAVTARR